MCDFSWDDELYQAHRLRAYRAMNILSSGNLGKRTKECRVFVPHVVEKLEMGGLSTRRGSDGRRSSLRRRLAPLPARAGGARPGPSFTEPL